MRVRLAGVAVCVALLGATGCGGSSKDPAPPPASAMSTTQTLAQQAKKDGLLRQPAASGLGKHRAEYLRSAQRVLGSRHVTVRVSEPGTVLVATRLNGLVTAADRAVVRRLRRVCSEVQQVTPKAQVVIAGRDASQLLSCPPK